MARFENLKDNINYIANNKLSNTSTYKKKLAIEDLKKALDVKSVYMYRSKQMGAGYLKSQNFNFLVNSIYEESNSFYDTNMRNSILKTITNQLVSKTLGDATFGIEENKIRISDGEDVYIGDIKISSDFIEEITKSLILFNDCYVKMNVNENGEMVPIVIKPFKVCKFENGYGHFYSKNGIDFLEKRVMEEKAYIYNYIYVEKRKEYELKEKIEIPTNQLEFYHVESKLDIVSVGLIEQILKYVELDTIYQKEIKLGDTNLFIDEQYKNRGSGRENLIPVKGPENLDANSLEKPLFEFVQPILRFNDLIIAKDDIKKEISTIMLMDNQTLGIDTSGVTATSIRVGNSTTISTINKIRGELSELINNALYIITGNDKNKINLSTYQINDVTSIINENATAINSNQMTIKTSVERLHPTWTNEEIEKEYLNLMYQNGIIYTAEEEIKAINYGIIPGVNFESENNGTIL